MIEPIMEFFRQHIILSNAAHVAGGFGLALVLQHYFPGKPFFSVKLGWVLIALAIAVHLYAYIAGTS